MADGHVPSRASMSVPLDVAVDSRPDGAPEGHRREGLLDRLGVGISVGCAAHCVAAGALTAVPGLVPGLGGAVAGHSGVAWLELLEWPFLVGAAVVGLSSLFPAFRHHGARSPLTFFGAGMAILAASRFVEGPAEIVLTTLGVAAVASAHVINLRLCRH